MKMLLITVVMMLVMIGLVSAVSISYDDFESNTFTGGLGWANDWSYTGDCEITTLSSPIGTYQMRGDSSCDVSRISDTSSYQNVKVTFYATASSLESADHCYYYYDGVELLHLQNGDDDGTLRYYEYNVTTSATGAFQMVTPTTLGDYCYVDNVVITGDDLTPTLHIYSDLEYQKMSLMEVPLTSSVGNIDHQFEVYHPNGTIICNETYTSPAVPYTEFTGECLLPDIAENNAYIYFSTIGANITKTFNIVDSQIDLTEVNIERVYFSPQVLQGGSTEIFAIVSGNTSVDEVTVKIIFPDNTSRIFSMTETLNSGEFRALITDTYQTHNTSFIIRAEGGVYFDTYENQYYVAPYSVDFVDTVNYVNELLEATIEVHGTEYVAGDNAKVWLQLQNETGGVVNDAICTVDIYTPSGTTFVEGGAMTNMEHDGIYYYDFIAPLTRGVYPAIAKCYFSGIQEFEYADGFVVDVGTANAGTYLDTYTQDSTNHDLREANVGGRKRVNATYTFDDMCGIDTSEDLLTGVSFIIHATWESISNDNINIQYYNFNSSSWVTLPNKIIAPTSGDLTVTNTVNLNNITTYGIVNSTGSTLVRLVDTDIADTGTDQLQVDYLSVACNQYADPTWQTLQGSSEAHIGSGGLAGDLGYYKEYIDYGYLRNDSFLDGFDIYYTIASQTSSDQEVNLLLPLFFPFPAIHVVELQYYNESGVWENLTYTSIIDELSGRDTISFDFTLSQGSNYEFRLINENYWKQKIFSDYENVNLMNDFISIACGDYVSQNNLTNITIPSDGTIVYPNDNFYQNCQTFLDAQYHYDIEMNNNFIPLKNYNGTFTLDQMYALETTYEHLEEAGHEIIQYGSVILDGLTSANGYSLALLEDPSLPTNPAYVAYFSSISTGYLNYVKNQQNYGSIFSVLSSIQTDLDDINQSIAITPELVWNYSGRTLTATEQSWIGGTEYSATETEGKVVVRMTDNAGVPVTGGTCTMTTYFNGSILINATPMTEFIGPPDGVYYVKFNLTGIGGVYPYTVDCLKTGKNYYLLGTYHIFDNSEVTDLLEEINQTTKSIYNILIGVDDILLQINNTLNNISSDIGLVNGKLINISNKLIDLRTEVDNNADFDQEAVFLITDSIVATQNALMTHEQTIIKEEMATVTNNLEEFKVVALGQEREEPGTDIAGMVDKGPLEFLTSKTFIFILAAALIIGSLNKNRREKQNEKNNIVSANNNDLYDRFS